MFKVYVDIVYIMIYIQSIHVGKIIKTDLWHTVKNIDP